MIRMISLAVIAVLAVGCAKNPSMPDYTAGKPADYNIAPLAESLDQDSEVRLLLDLIKLEMEQKNWNRAEELAQRYRYARPDDIVPYRLLASIYSQQSNYAMSRTAWQQVAQHPKATYKDKMGFAEYLVLQDEYIPAARIYQQIIDTESQSQAAKVMALNNIGFVQILQRHHAKARKSFQRALQLDPLNSKATHNLMLLDSIYSQEALNRE